MFFHIKTKKKFSDFDYKFIWSILNIFLKIKLAPSFDSTNKHYNLHEVTGFRTTRDVFKL